MNRHLLLILAAVLVTVAGTMITAPLGLAVAAACCAAAWWALAPAGDGED